jgi:Dna[CI] antecedent, DciA
MELIGVGIRAALSRFGVAAAMSDIVDVWPAVAGDAISRNAWPARLARDGTLHVATSSSAWAFELAQLEPGIAAGLRDALGEAAPAHLRFAVGRIPEADPTPPELPESRRVVPSPEDAEVARRMAAAIEDELLREAVAGAVAAGLARAAADRSF